MDYIFLLLYKSFLKEKSVVKKIPIEYMDYIERICENPLAVQVKYADLQDNMDLNRIPEPTEKDLARLEKYKLAKVRIEKAMKG